MKVELGEIALATIQQAGNKTNGEGIVFATVLNDITESSDFIKSLVRNTFKFEDLKHFDFVESLSLNPVYTFVSKIFEDRECFVKQTNNLVRHLYDQSLHPNIKNGEFYVLYIAGCIVDGAKTDAVLMLKSEKKDTFLTVCNNGEKISIKPNIGLNIKHIDKGCIVFNMAKKDGYVVATVDNINNGKDAHYWTDSFLHVVNCNDDYHSTIQMANMCGDFIRQMQKENPEQCVKLAKAARSTTQLLQTESSISIAQMVDLLSYSDEVKQKFEKYKADYEQTYGALPDTFQMQANVANRKAISRMNILKLGNDFEIKLLNPQAEIEAGYDTERGLKYYKLYFE